MRWPFSKRSGTGHEVVFHSYPKLIFIWPIIAAGFLFYFLPTGAGEVLAWLYLLLVALVTLTIGVDIERNHAIWWAAVFGLFYFLGRWLADAKQFTLFGDVYRWFADLDVTYDRKFGFCLSVLLLGPYLVMLAWARLQHRWRITHNEFEHYSWGRADDSLARGAKRVRSTFPDLLELLICGSGTLIVYSATGRSELRRIPNVPMIFLVRRRINKLLEYTAVTEARADIAESEEEEEEMAGTRAESLSGQVEDRREPL